MTASIKSGFWNTNVGKTLKTALYLGISGAISYAVTATTNDPALFGSVTAIVNLALVFVKQTWFSDSTRNVGAN